MSERRWRDGDRLEVDGMHFRVVQGKKSVDDLRLDAWTPHVGTAGMWRPAKMQLGAVLADFFFENEDMLYPRNELNPRTGAPYRGGFYYLDYCHQAALNGFDKADTVLRFERARKWLTDPDAAA